ncbi:MAG: hypothetical protein H7246_20420 [Phycisphaerae bacterium]|nr:hypothetical protein [Saprospiraceae bacterium]
MKKPFLFGLVFVSFSLAAQSPWPRSKAGFFVQAAWNFIPTYTTLFGPEGKDIVLDREVSEHNIQLYGEYGLSKKTTLIAAIPFAINKRGAFNPDSPFMFGNKGDVSIAGFGNTTLALRHQFFQRKLALAGTLRVGFPAIADYKSPGLRTGYNAFTVLPMVNAGMGFGQLYCFFYGGYGYRSNHYSHFLNFGGEMGLHLGKVWLIGFSETVFPLENGSRKLPPIDELTGLYVNNQGWVSVGVKALWQINRFVGLNLSGAGAAWAQNVPKSPGLSLGVYFKWD